MLGSRVMPNFAYLKAVADSLEFYVAKPMDITYLVCTRTLAIYSVRSCKWIINAISIHMQPLQ